MSWHILPSEARERVYIFYRRFMKEVRNSLFEVLEEPPEFATIFSAREMPETLPTIAPVSEFLPYAL